MVFHGGRDHFAILRIMQQGFQGVLQDPMPSSTES